MTQRFIRRIAKEIVSLQKNKYSGINIIFPNNDQSAYDSEQKSIEELRIKIKGADDTLYTGEEYILLFKFNINYPISAPDVIFIGNIPINEHVYSNGHICLDILYDDWSAAFTLETICMSIVSLLSEASKKIKPPNDDFYCKVSKNKSPKDFKWSYNH